MKLGAFLVTFNRPAALKHSIESMLSQTRPPDALLIVDNGDGEETRELLREFPDGIELAATGANLGSAGGTEFGYRLLHDRGLDFIYCGDDDNPPRTADTLGRLVRLLESADSGVGGTGTVGARWSWQTGRIERLPDKELHGLVEVDFIGGDHKQLLRREVIEQVGPPNGHLFFGYPDLEHCLRIRRGGFRLMIDADLMRCYRKLNRRLGPSASRSPVPRRSLDSAWRNYYTTRNYIYMMRRTFDRPDLARREALRAVARSMASWRRGLRYGAHFLPLQLRAVVDGYVGRLGLTVMPVPKSVSSR